MNESDLPHLHAYRSTAGDGQVFQGQQDVFQEDHYGTEEGTDPNP